MKYWSEYCSHVDPRVGPVPPVFWPSMDPSVDFPDLDVSKWEALFDAENELIAIVPKSKAEAVCAALNLELELD